MSESPVCEQEATASTILPGQLRCFRCRDAADQLIAEGQIDLDLRDDDPLLRDPRLFVVLDRVVGHALEPELGPVWATLMPLGLRELDEASIVEFSDAIDLGA